MNKIKHIYYLLILSLNLTSISISNQLEKQIFISEIDSTDISTVDYDGPYVIYRNSSTILKQVLKNYNSFYNKTDSFSGSVRGKIITCNINDSISFITKIKDTLINESSVYEMPEKLIAVSDIEGNFIPLRDFLMNNKVINSSSQWIFGSGHLVLNGDMFDRGLNVTECLWFIYHLEQEAVKYGGYVHFILGNHEIMNMNDDIRYLRNKYLDNSMLMNEDYMNLYKPNTELGRWLATKNIIEKIGTYLFLHGGVSPQLDSLNLTVEEINNRAREYYYNSSSAKNNDDAMLRIIYSGKTSPFWYRGYVSETTKEDELMTTLNNFNVSKIVVGHTVVDDAKYFYSGRIIAIDTDHAEGDSEGALMENGKEYRIDKFGNRSILK